MFVYLWKFWWKKIQSSLRVVKIVLCIIVAYLLIFSIFANTIQKNSQNIYQNQNKLTFKKDDAINSLITNKKINSSKMGKVFISLYKNMTCSILGEACYSDLNKKNPVRASTYITSILAYPFLNPPASGVGATTQALAEAGFIPNSYAAEGIGFASIRPLMSLWKAMRDVSYLILVIVIVTIGFMIMLRSKINPQTVVNVENSLPKIVMALIYITFSFAIAGFLIDLMYVSIILVISILGPTQITTASISIGSWNIATWKTVKTTNDLMSTFLQASPWNIMDVISNFNAPWYIFWSLPSALLGVLDNGINTLIRLIIGAASAFFLVPYIDRFLVFIGTPGIDIGVSLAGVATIKDILPTLGKYSAAIGTWVIAIIIGSLLVPLIIGLIIFMTAIMLFFRIFMLLFSNYIKLLVLIIIAPLYLLLEAIPGQSSFGSWIKNLLEFLVTFPVMIATFLIGSIIMNTAAQGNLWTPPFLIGLNADVLPAIIGMWILFMIPEFVGIAQKAVNPKPMPLEAGIGTFFGGAKSGIETGLGEAGKYALLADRIKPLGRIYEMFGMGNKQGHK
jgi:hypothetical protein